MRFKISYPSKKYLWNIMQWTSAAVLLVVIVLSTAVYLNSQRILLQKEYEKNMEVFNQAQININMMDQMARNLCMSLYLNSDVDVIMYARQEDAIDVTTRINRVVSTAISSNPYIHSVTIYNNQLHKFYNAGQSLFFDDKQLAEMIEGNKQIAKLKVLPRRIEKLVNDKVTYEDVFSYFMFDNNGSSGGMDGGITVNVRTDWFLENIRQINMIKREQGDNAFVLNNNNEFIEVTQEDEEMKDWLKTEYVTYKSSNKTNDDVGFFQSGYKGTKYLVTYSYVNSMDITIIKVQKLSEIYKSINSLRTSVIIITLVLLFGALLIFAIVSRRIYKPVGKLVQLISNDKSQNTDNRKITDEMSYLNDFYKSTIEKLDAYHKEKYQQKDIMKNYWLNRLLTDSYTINAKSAAEIFQEGKICLSQTDNYVVCLLHVDNYKAFMQEYNSKDMELLRFAIINISSEVIDSKYKNEGIDMKEDRVALIISVPPEDENYQENIADLIREIQNYIKQYFKLSVSASVSSRNDDIKKLTLLYNEAADNKAYRMILGHSCIVTPDLPGRNERKNESGRLKELETGLIDKVKAGKSEEIEEALKEVFIEISLMDYNQILISLINLAGEINNSLDSIKRPADKHVHFDFNSFCQNIMEKETLSEIHDMMADMLGEILGDKEEQTVQSKDGYIVDAVREFIQKNYSDSSLSLTKISVVMNISQRRLSKVFKDEVQVSVADYINNVRLDKAAELLKTTSLNVNEVISRLGIENETYFYGLFKKKFGLTPKEYAFKRIVNMTQE